MSIAKYPANSHEPTFIPPAKIDLLVHSRLASKKRVYTMTSENKPHSYSHSLGESFDIFCIHLVAYTTFDRLVGLLGIEISH
ncbi:hypothetical protein HZ326_11764 [Fusarium oxysporum f. sp. albedinis]|nr:hypothetical protein HZ326_11764 [Fusarium oxysporum f. sp. albedinis]